MDYLITVLVGCIIGLILAGQYTYHIEKVKKAQQVVCAPYSVLSNYELLGRKYVICGNNGHKEYK